MSRFSNRGMVATWILFTAGKAAAWTREMVAIRATTALGIIVAENFMLETIVVGVGNERVS